MTMDLSELTEDGDTLDIGNGRTLRLRVESDDVDPFDMFDTYGRVEPAEHGYDRNGMRRGRPAGFDGNAEKIWLQQNAGCVWWQPPADVKRTDEGFAKLREAVNDLASFGMKSYGLEILEGTDAYGQPIVTDVAWLGGIEPFPDDAYVAEVVADLVAELNL